MPKTDVMRNDRDDSHYAGYLSSKYIEQVETGIRLSYRNHVRYNTATFAKFQETVSTPETWTKLTEDTQYEAGLVLLRQGQGAVITLLNGINRDKRKFACVADLLIKSSRLLVNKIDFLSPAEIADLAACQLVLAPTLDAYLDKNRAVLDLPPTVTAASLFARPAGK